MKKTTLALIAISFFSFSVYAQRATPGIDKTQKDQQERIKNGIKDGDLTKSETRKLERQQRNIQEDKLIAKSDGVVTKKERKHIRKEQVAASKSIYRKKHNKRSNE